jgi:hypothetical protein
MLCFPIYVALGLLPRAPTLGEIAVDKMRLQLMKKQSSMVDHFLRIVEQENIEVSSKL